MSDIFSAPISRRSLLAGSGGLSIGAMLALSGCSADDSSNSTSSGEEFTGTLTFLLPGNVPTGWDPVKEAVNKKLKTDLGFTIDPQFISWADYGTQALLRFTSGANFDTALQARWLNMAQLVTDKALVDLTDMVGSGDYSNLKNTIDPKLLEANKWGDALYGIPQVNGAARLHHFSIRQDLAEQYGMGEITDFEGLERYWYTIKQKNPDVIPVLLNTGSGRNTVFGPVTPLFNAYSWDNADTPGWNFTGDSLWFALDKNAARTGSSDPVPFWEADGVVEALNRVRKYQQDGILNGDVLNLDTKAAEALFTAGKGGTVWAITDGQSSNLLPVLQQAVPNAMMANVMPLKGGLKAKPHQTFQADNFVVLNARGQSHEAAMALQDWVSIKENHDLIGYGLEGTDWKAEGDDKIELTSQYRFPGFALCWRTPLERKATSMSPTEETIFEWSKNTENFTLDTFASFLPDVTPVKSQNSQMAAVMTQYAKPLFAGVVDVKDGLDQLKKAAEGAGLAALQEELAKQADAYLKNKG
jgi:putative aldouronate transport system substrate-binding protein